MAILIVDPSKEGQTAATAVLQWADHRHNIQVAEDAASALEMALEMEPGLIFCVPNLPDMGGDQLCTQLRSRLPATTFLAYTNNPLEIDAKTHIFDGILEKPPCRYQVMSYLQVARDKKKAAAKNRARSIGEDEIHQFPRMAESTIGSRTNITVCIAEDELKFVVPVYGDATLSQALNGMGKRKITWYSVTRNGQDFLCNDPSFKLMNGDTLTIKT